MTDGIYENDGYHLHQHHNTNHSHQSHPHTHPQPHPVSQSVLHNNNLHSGSGGHNNQPQYSNHQPSMDEDTRPSPSPTRDDTDSPAVYANHVRSSVMSKQVSSITSSILNHNLFQQQQQQHHNRSDDHLPSMKSTTNGNSNVTSSSDGRDPKDRDSNHNHIQSSLPPHHPHHPFHRSSHGPPPPPPPPPPTSGSPSNQLGHQQNAETASQSTIPQLLHWSQVIYECSDLKLEDWMIAGGSDYGQMPYLMESGDILLEVRNQRVAGLTRSDVLNLIKGPSLDSPSGSTQPNGEADTEQSPSPSSVTFKAVSSSQSFGLPIDLREYLSRRFVRGSVDHDLQATIRDNVYLRTIPCTTRPPRPGEVDNVDYKFVTRDEFVVMERSGVLLESGLFSGHYYGTPLPLSTPNTPTINLTGSTHFEHHSLAINDSAQPQTETKEEGDVNGNDPSSSKEPSTPNSLAAKRKRNRSNIAAIDASSLPHGWEKISDAQYGVYYIDHVNKRTQYERPYELELTKGSSGFGFTLIELDRGLIVVKNVIAGGAAAVSGVIQPGDVLVSVGGNPCSGLSHSQVADTFASYVVGDRVKLTFARGYQLPPEIQSEELEFEYMTVQIVKGANGFGFTISDGNVGQRVKKVLDPERCGTLKQGDILCSVNGNNLGPLVHTQVVDILKECTIGETATITIKRKKRFRSKTPNILMSTGYPSVSNDPNGDGDSTSLAATRTLKTPTSSDVFMMMRGRDGSGTGVHAPLMNPNQVPPPPPPHPPPHMIQQHGMMMSGSSTMPNLMAPTGTGYEDTINGNQLDAMDNGQYGVPMSPQSQPQQMIPSSKSAPHLYRVPGVDYNDLMPSPEPFQFLDTVPQVSEEEEFEYHRCDLRRSEAGFGFRIVGGAEERRNVAIGSIVIGGVAHADGTLKSGDEILTINDVNVTTSSHHHVVELMSQCGSNVSLVVRRRKDSESFEVILTRDDSEGFGFVLISCGIMCLIGRIIDGSPAQRCQRLRVRDRIIAVNGIDITTMSHPDIVNMIKESGRSLHMKIIPADCYTVELVRGTRGFGFSIRGGAEFNGMPLFILRIAPDGPAYSLLNVGDEIIEINACCTVNMAHTDAVSLISQSGPQVKLKLRRYISSSPSPNSNHFPSAAQLTPTGASYSPSFAIPGQVMDTPGQLTPQSGHQQQQQQQQMMMQQQQHMMQQHPQYPYSAPNLNVNQMMGHHQPNFNRNTSYAMQ